MSLPTPTLALLLALFPQSLPERPSLQREVTGIVDVGGPAEQDHDARFQRPHVPAYRTTQDGRVAMSVDFNPRFTVVVPEKLGGPVLLASPGGATMSAPTTAWVGGDAATQRAILTAGSGREIVHTCLWDDALPVANTAGQDVYHLKALVTTTTSADPGSVQFFVTPLRVVVDRPKTAAATIVELTPTGPTLAGPDYAHHGAGSFHGSAFEPTIAGDGRLIVFRVLSTDLPTPNGPTSVDIVYSYYEDPTGALGTANPAGWTQVFPIAHAHHDSRLNGANGRPPFGFALYPLTDAAGTPIGMWEDLGATYPWIDREAKNLFFTTVGDTLHFQDPSPQFPNRDPRSAAEWHNTRYEAVGVPGDPRERWGFESQELFQGAAFAGLWTHGRLVLADGFLNDMDFAIGSSRASTYGQMPYNVGPQQRLVRLFAGSPTPSLDPASGWVRLGYGRANESPALPAGENTNTTILDSLQAKLAYRAHTRPLVPRDVVWHVSNGKHTDEVVFDDHVDPDALVVADMVGLVTAPDPSGSGFNTLVHHSGWDRVARAFSAPVRLQNAATYTERWDLPPFGEVQGHGNTRGRLEPAALGGVHGKGLWLEGGVGLVFAAPRPKVGTLPTPEAFYVGLFVDCRFDDDGLRRPLLRFPDGSAVELVGRRQVLVSRGGVVLGRASLPLPFVYTPAGGGAPVVHEPLAHGRYTHLGLRIERGGRRTTVLLDGFAVGRLEHPSLTACVPLVGPGATGELAVGGPAATGPGFAPFRGWVDELRVFAHDVDPESAANHAGATLLGFDAAPGATDWHNRWAEALPGFAHDDVTAALVRRGEPVHARYGPRFDPRYDAARGLAALGAGPANAVPLRAAIHFPEGPLYQDRPRPDSTSNVFCTTCHHTDGEAGLSLAALEHRSLLARDDPRRQPSQPPARLGGVVPDGLVDAGPAPLPRPGEARPTGTEVTWVDRWLLPRRGRRVAEVVGVSVLDAATGRDLGALVAGATLDPAVLGSAAIDLEANLDVGQGATRLALRERLGSGAVVTLASRTVAHGAPRLYGTPSGLALRAGSFELVVTPERGVTRAWRFDVVGGARRQVGRVTDTFRAFAPRDGWVFAWTSGAGPLAAAGYTPLAYEPQAGRFDETGLAGASTGAFGDGHLNALGGRPGPGSAQGPSGVERAVAVGRQVTVAGHWLPRGLGATSTQGGAVTVRALHVDAASGAVTTLYEATRGGGAVGPPTVALGPYPMAPGDFVWFVVAPGTDDVGDTFVWDPWLEYAERPWSGVAD